MLWVVLAWAMSAVVSRTDGAVVCAGAGLACQHGGTIDEKDCHESLSSSKWEAQSMCECPDGFSGINCQFYKESAMKCPAGQVYSDSGFTEVGEQISQCTIKKTAPLNTPFLRFRDHSVHMTLNAANRSMRFVIQSRTGKWMYYHSMTLLQCESSQCQLIRHPAIEGRSPAYHSLECTQNECSSCLNGTAKDLAVCPTMAMSSMLKWQELKLPIMYKLLDSKDGQFVMDLALTRLPFIGSLLMQATCITGMCITPFLNHVSTVEMSSIVSPMVDPVYKMVMIIAPLAFLSLLVLVVAIAVGVVRAERCRPPARLMNASSSANQFGETPKRFGSGLIWHKLSYEISPSLGERLYFRGRHKSRQLILNESSGRIQGPQLIALIGRSGCGKSTFLDVLAGTAKFSGTRTGTIVWQGPIQRVSYLCQSDVMLESLTVFETLEFSAVTRGGHTSLDKAARAVAIVLDELALTALASSLVAEISGGEKRRVALGVELVSEPDFMILDEPTTGLDSHTADIVLRVLRKRASYCTILMTVHQPPADYFDQFDRTILMGSSGRIVFDGRPRSAAVFVAKHTGTEIEPGTNPFEFILESLDNGRSLNDMWSTFQNSESLSGSEFVCSTCSSVVQKPLSACESFALWVRRFCCLTLRLWRNTARDSHCLSAYYACTIIAATLLGLTFYDVDLRMTSGAQSRLGFFSCTTLVMSMIGLSTVSLFARERIVIRRELSAGMYSPAILFWAKLTVDLIPFRVVPSLLFAVIPYFLVGLQTSFAKFVQFVSIMTLTNMAGGAAISSIAFATDRLRTANLAGAIYFLMNFALGSTLLSRMVGGAGVIGHLRHLCFFTYATEAMCAIEFDGISIINDAPFLEGNYLPMDGEAYILQLGLVAENLWFDFSILGVFIVALSMLSFALLACRANNSSPRRDTLLIEHLPNVISSADLTSSTTCSMRYVF